LSTSTDNSIDVSILPPLDNGGSAVTQYRVEWDVLGAEAWDSSAPLISYTSSARKSFLYSPYAVQRIQSSADDYSLSGYFTIGFGGYSSDRVKVDATASELAAILSACLLSATSKLLAPSLIISKATHGPLLF